ncbi:ImpA family metalloprotease, partial [Vibrio thalassae]
LGLTFDGANEADYQAAIAAEASIADVAALQAVIDEVDAQQDSISMEGSVVANDISGATVEFFSINDDGSIIEKLNIGDADVITDVNGNYTAQIKPTDTRVLVVATNGNYLDESTGLNVDMTNQSLRAVMEQAVNSETLVITPLSEAVAQLAEGDFSQAKIAMLRQQVAQEFLGTNDPDLMDKLRAVDLSSSEKAEEYIAENGLEAFEKARNMREVLAGLSIEAGGRKPNQAITDLVNTLKADGQLSQAIKERMYRDTRRLMKRLDKSGRQASITNKLFNLTSTKVAELEQEMDDDDFIQGVPEEIQVGSGTSNLLAQIDNQYLERFNITFVLISDGVRSQVDDPTTFTVPTNISEYVLETRYVDKTRPSIRFVEHSKLTNVQNSVNYQLSISDLQTNGRHTLSLENNGSESANIQVFNLSPKVVQTGAFNYLTPAQLTDMTVLRDGTATFRLVDIAKHYDELVTFKVLTPRSAPIITWALNVNGDLQVGSISADSSNVNVSYQNADSTLTLMTVLPVDRNTTESLSWSVVKDGVRFSNIQTASIESIVNPLALTNLTTRVANSAINDVDLFVEFIGLSDVSSDVAILSQYRSALTNTTVSTMTQLNALIAEVNSSQSNTDTLFVELQNTATNDVTMSQLKALFPNQYLPESLLSYYQATLATNSWSTPEEVEALIVLVNTQNALDEDNDGVLGINDSDDNNPYTDNDGDGLPDRIETDFGLNPNDASDVDLSIDNNSDGIPDVLASIQASLPTPNQFDTDIWLDYHAQLTTSPALVITDLITQPFEKTLDLSNLSGEVSYEFIVKFTQNSANIGGLLGHRNNAEGLDTHWQIRFEQSADNMGATLYGTYDYVFTPVNGQSIASPYGSTSHVVIVGRGSQTEMWVNGVHVGSITQNAILINHPTTPLGIHSGTVQAGDGIYGFAAHNRALSQDEIASTYHIAFSIYSDSDNDGLYNVVDLDDDNDGVNDWVDQFPLDGTEWADIDGDGIADNSDISVIDGPTGDADGDGVLNQDDLDNISVSIYDAGKVLLSATTENNVDTWRFRINEGEWQVAATNPVIVELANGEARFDLEVLDGVDGEVIGGAILFTNISTVPRISSGWESAIPTLQADHANALFALEKQDETLATEQELVNLINASIDLKSSLQDPIKQYFWQGVGSVNWSTGRRAGTFSSGLASSLELLPSTSAADGAGKNLLLVAQQGSWRYVVPANSMFVGAMNDSGMNALTHNVLDWVVGDESADKQIEIVVANIANNGYSAHWENLLAWLNREYAGRYTINNVGSCDGAALLGCLQAVSPDLVIVGDENANIHTGSDMSDAFNYLKENAIPTILEHQERYGVSDLTAGLRSLMKVTPTSTGQNTVATNVTLASSQGANPLMNTKDLFERLQTGNWNYEAAKNCGSGDAIGVLLDCTIPALNADLFDDVNVLSEMLRGYDSTKNNPFDVIDPLTQSLLLLAQKYRLQIDYPIEINAGTAKEYINALYAELMVSHSWAEQKAQPDLGRYFGQANETIIKGENFHYNYPETVVNQQRTLGIDSKNWSLGFDSDYRYYASQRQWTMTGWYALPGVPVTITRNDMADSTVSKVSIRLHYARRGTHRILDEHWSPIMEQKEIFDLANNESVTFSTPYGAPIYLAIDGGNINRYSQFTVTGAANHPAIFDASDLAQREAFFDMLDTVEIPHLDIKYGRHEAHSTLSDYLDGVNLFGGDREKHLESWYKDHIFVYWMNGLAVEQSETMEEVLSPDVMQACINLVDEASCKDTTLHGHQFVQHYNYDYYPMIYTASGISGNPSDQGTSLSVIFGNASDNHELGHQQQRKRLEAFGTNNRNSWSTYYWMSTETQIDVYRDIAIENYYQRHQVQDRYAMWKHAGSLETSSRMISVLADMRNGSNQRVSLRQHVDGTCEVHITDKGEDSLNFTEQRGVYGRAVSESFFKQIVYQGRGMRLRDGTVLRDQHGLHTMLRIWERQFMLAMNGVWQYTDEENEVRWAGLRDDLGFSLFPFKGTNAYNTDYGNDRDMRSIPGNDFMLVALSYITGLDWVPYFKMYDMPVSDLAMAQSAVNGIHGVKETGLYAHEGLSIPWDGIAGIPWMHIDIDNPSARYPFGDSSPLDCDGAGVSVPNPPVNVDFTRNADGTIDLAMSTVQGASLAVTNNTPTIINYDSANQRVTVLQDGVAELQITGGATNRIFKFQVVASEIQDLGLVFSEDNARGTIVLTQGSTDNLYYRMYGKEYRVLDYLEFTPNLLGDPITFFYRTPKGLVYSIEQDYDLSSFYVEADSDGDGLPDRYELARGQHPYSPGDGDLDTDSDGLTDAYELAWNLNPDSDLDGADVDSDNDGVSNLEESLAGSDPLDSTSYDRDRDGVFGADDVDDNNPYSDTDGDLIADIVETNAGFDPLDPLDIDYSIDENNDGTADIWAQLQATFPAQGEIGVTAWMQHISGLSVPAEVVVTDFVNEANQMPLDLSALSGDVSYEFLVDLPVDRSGKVVLLGARDNSIGLNTIWTLSFEQGGQTPATLGLTKFGAGDYIFTAVDGQSVDSPYGDPVHIVYIARNGSSEVWVNGVQVGSFSDALLINDPQTPLGINEGNANAGEGIYAFAAHNRALTASEIEAAYRKGTSIYEDTDGDGIYNVLDLDDDNDGYFDDGTSDDQGIGLGVAIGGISGDINVLIASNTTVSYELLTSSSILNDVRNEPYLSLYNSEFTKAGIVKGNVHLQQIINAVNTSIDTVTAIGVAADSNDGQTISFENLSAVIDLADVNEDNLGYYQALIAMNTSTTLATVSDLQTLVNNANASQTQLDALTLMAESQNASSLTLAMLQGVFGLTITDANLETYRMFIASSDAAEVGNLTSLQAMITEADAYVIDPTLGITGHVVLANISGASVQAIELVNGAKGTDLARGTVMLDANGDFSLVISATAHPVLIEVTGGTYQDDSTGLTRSNTVISAVLPEVKRRDHVIVSPVTDIAAHMVQTDYSLSAINSANTALAQWMMGSMDANAPFSVMPSTLDSTGTGEAEAYRVSLTGLSVLGSGQSISVVNSAIALDATDGAIEEATAKMMYFNTQHWLRRHGLTDLALNVPSFGLDAAAQQAVDTLLANNPILGYFPERMQTNTGTLDLTALLGGDLPASLTPSFSVLAGDSLVDLPSGQLDTGLYGNEMLVEVTFDLEGVEYLENVVLLPQTSPVVVTATLGDIANDVNALTTSNSLNAPVSVTNFTPDVISIENDEITVLESGVARLLIADENHDWEKVVRFNVRDESEIDGITWGLNNSGELVVVSLDGDASSIVMTYQGNTTRLSDFMSLVFDRSLNETFTLQVEKDGVVFSEPQTQSIAEINNEIAIANLANRVADLTIDDADIFAEFMYLSGVRTDATSMAKYRETLSGQTINSLDELNSLISVTNEFLDVFVQLKSNIASNITLEALATASPDSTLYDFALAQYQTALPKTNWQTQTDLALVIEYVNRNLDLPASGTLNLAAWMVQATSGVEAVATHDTELRGTASTMVDLSALSGDVSYEFLLHYPADNFLSGGMLAESGNGALRFEVWRDTNTYGYTKFGDGDYRFTAVNGASVASVFGRVVHVIYTISGSTASLYIDGEYVGTGGNAFLINSASSTLGNNDSGSFTNNDVIYAFAAYNEALAIEEIASHYQVALSVYPDSDGDGLLDYIELALGLDPTDVNDGATADSDTDGFTNLQEFQSGTDPLNGADYDADGDGVSVLHDVDDNDPLTDTDGDGLQDSIEFAIGFNPLNPNDIDFTIDDDNDGKADIWTLIQSNTDALNGDFTDTDGDGLYDFFDPDDNNDGVLDNGEPDVTSYGSGAVTANLVVELNQMLAANTNITASYLTGSGQLSNIETANEAQYNQAFVAQGTVTSVAQIQDTIDIVNGLAVIATANQAGDASTITLSDLQAIPNLNNLDAAALVQYQTDIVNAPAADLVTLAQVQTLIDNANANQIRVDNIAAYAGTNASALTDAMLAAITGLSFDSNNLTYYREFIQDSLESELNDIVKMQSVIDQADAYALDPQWTVTGQAVANNISGATVRVYAIESGAKGTDLTKTAGTTDANGAFDMTIVPTTLPVMMEITGGMYIDEATGISLNSGTLTTVLPEIARRDSVTVSPLTDIAAKVAATDLSVTGINSANALIASTFLDSTNADDVFAIAPAAMNATGSGLPQQYRTALIGLSVLGGGEALANVTQDIATDLADNTLDVNTAKALYLNTQTWLRRHGMTDLSLNVPTYGLDSAAQQAVDAVLANDTTLAYFPEILQTSTGTLDLTALLSGYLPTGSSVSVSLLDGDSLTALIGTLDTSLYSSGAQLQVSVDVDGVARLESITLQPSATPVSVTSTLGDINNGSHSFTVTPSDSQTVTIESLTPDVATFANDSISVINDGIARFAITAADNAWQEVVSIDVLSPRTVPSITWQLDSNGDLQVASINGDNNHVNLTYQGVDSSLILMSTLPVDRSASDTISWSVIKDGVRFSNVASQDVVDVVNPLAVANLAARVADTNIADADLFAHFIGLTGVSSDATVLSLYRSELANQAVTSLTALENTIASVNGTATAFIALQNTPNANITIEQIQTLLPTQYLAASLIAEYQAALAGNV